MHPYMHRYTHPPTPRGEYPMHVIAASLATYGFRIRLVYRGYASHELNPRKGITARSPFATGDPWFVCSDFMHKIVEQLPEIRFGIRVDGLSYSAEDEDENKLVDELVTAHERVQTGMRDEV